MSDTTTSTEPSAEADVDGRALAEAVASGGGEFPVNADRGEVAVPWSQVDAGWAVARLTHAAEEMAESLLPGRQVGEVFAALTMGTGIRAGEVTALLWAALEAGWAQRQGSPVDALGGSRWKRRDILDLIEELGRERAEQIVAALLVLGSARRELVAGMDRAAEEGGGVPLSVTARRVATGERIGVDFVELWSVLALPIQRASGGSPWGSRSSSSTPSTSSDGGTGT